MNKKIVLGEEYDEGLKKAINEVLSKQGATEVNRSWGVGGSQEIETVQFKLDDELITLESESFIGLSLEGQDSLVEGLARKIREIRS